ncbi:DEKNAAC102469 [Brettanomyces naardenensis]|uniref:Serine/threonine-protein phosphatase 2A activator n=1 Tax=Brettanomyces naardenensis TaxID=13370 RepID=A0A448YKS1_BRENA|nr:DEKNAAC102469 [Brettanomyces naardenensis]
MTKFLQPVKRLHTEEDLKKFQVSLTHHAVMDFIQRLANSVHGLELTDKTLPVNDRIQSILDILEEVDKISESHPIRLDTTSRFGKVEFRDFFDELSARATSLLHNHIHLDYDTGNDFTVELSTYLINSFGDRERIDYGSGHELNFLCFLYILDHLGYFESSEYDKSVVLKIFARYIQTMRGLQLKYWLEPAGSHGVWGLDDYHFLPFLFGAAQLSPFTRPRPLSIHNKDYVTEFKDKYFYFACINFINETKIGTTSLRQSSPMLDDISGVKTWKKIEEGMLKMYDAEVLSKLPVVQHFLFGAILPCPEGVPEHYDDEVDEDGCNHEVHSSWGDCCGIKVPSAVAASAMEHKKHHVPFD